MNPALRTAASGMAAQQLKTDAIAHNLANVNTTAFKRSTPVFESLLYQKVQGARVVDQAQAETLPGVHVGRGVRAVGNPKVFTQGALNETGRPLDLAIAGDGFFVVERGDGQMAYTRDGSLQISDQGILMTQAGHALAGDIRIPQDATSISISEEGIVSVTVPGSTEPQQIGEIQLARFVNPAGLEPTGGNLYLQTPASGESMIGLANQDGLGQIKQSMLEGSNVDPIASMVDLISAQRGYSLSMRAVTAADQMMEQTSAMVR